MALVTNRISDTITRKARSKLGIRFGRFAVAAIAAFATTEIVFTIDAGPLGLSATWATLIAWFSGALVSYILSRWAWKRKGRPSLLKETLPFWIVSAMVVAILILASKFGYHSATWMRLHGVERVLYLAAVYGVANLGTFVLRFLFCHYVLFASSAGWPAPPPPRRRWPRPTRDPSRSPGPSRSSPKPRTRKTPKTAEVPSA